MQLLATRRCIAAVGETIVGRVEFLLHFKGFRRRSFAA
jgi:hypothetical protein